MNQERLFKDKSNCCGCGACANICPKKAIDMVEDEYGFKYPQINSTICIDCGLCKKNCSYQNKIELSTNKETYVAVSKDSRVLNNSASGGIFAQIAINFIKNRGIVYGCSMERINKTLVPMHIRVDNIEELEKLQGSKYVQSDMNNIYLLIREDLNNGKKVLFSGTPCQVAAIKQFLKKEEKNKLFTLDIICHGVPSKKMFQDYITYLEQSKKITVQSFTFRDKTKEWGLYAKIKYMDSKKREKEKIIESHFSSYYQLFLDADIYRDNCYSCKYAGKDRAGDISIGDYWGINKEHPEYLKGNNGEIEEKKGVSCVLVNSEIGKELIKQYSNGILIKESEFFKAARRNKQLNRPSEEKETRKEFLDVYKERGYEGLEKKYIKKIGIKKYLYYIWQMIPRRYKEKLKK